MITTWKTKCSNVSISEQCLSSLTSYLISKRMLVLMRIISYILSPQPGGAMDSSVLSCTFCFLWHAMLLTMSCILMECQRSKLLSNIYSNLKLIKLLNELQNNQGQKFQSEGELIDIVLYHSDAYYFLVKKQCKHWVWKQKVLYFLSNFFVLLYSSATSSWSSFLQNGIALFFLKLMQFKWIVFNLLNRIINYSDSL
jgi:hypothetical protein